MSHSQQQRLRDRDPAVRAAACRDIREDPSAVLLLGDLVTALADEERVVSRAASDALATLALRFDEVPPLLRQALHGDAPRQRWAAAFTLSRLEPPSLGLVPAAVEAMASPDGDVRWAAARLLVETGRLHEEAARLLLQLLTDGDSAAVRRMAAFALRELAPDHADALQALVEATADSDVAVKRAALTALASASQPPESVLVRLREVLEGDEDQASRSLAALALGEIGAAHPDLMPAAIVAALETSAARADTRAGPRRAAARALERLALVSRPLGD